LEKARQLKLRLLRNTNGLWLQIMVAGGGALRRRNASGNHEGKRERSLLYRSAGAKNWTRGQFLLDGIEAGLAPVSHGF
jgi:hypothetical protein